MAKRAASQAAKAVAKQSEVRSMPDLAQRLSEIRANRKLTLRELQVLTGIPASTLSKVENGQATLSYGALVRLAQGLSIEVSDLFSRRTVDVKAGRRAITRRGTAPREATERYIFELLCSELINKQLNPAILEITARSLEEAGGLLAHEGEEFIYVLSGALEVHSEDYRLIRLEPGDALYLDSMSGHAYVNAGKEPARILAVTTHLPKEANRAGEAAPAPRAAGKRP